MPTIDLRAVFMLGFDNPDLKLPNRAEYPEFSLLIVGQVFAKSDKHPPKHIYYDVDGFVNISTDLIKTYMVTTLKRDIVLLDNYGQFACPQKVKDFSKPTPVRKLKNVFA